MRGGLLRSTKFFSLFAAFFLVFASATVLIDAKPAIADPCPSGWTFVGVNCERTYFYTGDKQTFTVPNGVRNVFFIAAGGGSITTGGNTSGNSAVVSGVLPTNGGEVLNLYVGGTGTSIKGGWNGGGDGSISYYSSYQPTASQIRDPFFTAPVGIGKGAGGGGATDIRVNGTSLSHRKVVAGGAGGYAMYWQCSPQGWIYAGDGTAQPAYCNTQQIYNGSNAYGVGGTMPTTGLAPVGLMAGLQGGNATSNAGGTRGGLFPVNNWVGCDTVNYSTAGSLGVGGSAGGLQRSTEPSYVRNGWTWEWCSGGGGGGGYYGGGGGTFGGGGAGSSYLDPTIINNTAAWEASFIKPPSDAFYSGSIKKYGSNPFAVVGNTVTTVDTVPTNPAPAGYGGGFIRLAYRGTTVLSVVPQAVNADRETTSKSIDYVVTFAEGVTGFGLGNLSISGSSGTNGTWTTSIVSGASGSSTYTVRLENSSAIDGPVTLTADATGTLSVTNVPGLGNLSGTAIIDTTGPALSAGVTNPTSTKTAPVTYTYTFDEAISFVGGTPDLTKIAFDSTVTPTTASLNNWVIGSPVITGNTLTFTITNPTALTSADSGLLTLKLSPGLLQDALGNATSVASTAAVEIDYTVPAVVSFLPPADTKVSGATRYFNAATVPYTLSFSEDVRHLYASNYATAARQSFAFTGSGATGCIATPAASFTTNKQVIVNVTGCTDGTIILKLLANRVEDLAGNNATYGAGNALVADNIAATITKDTVAPGWTAGLASASSANANQIDYTFTFNSPVYGIEANDLVLSGNSGTNGTWTRALTGSSGSTAYTIRITNSDPITGILNAALPAGAGTDIAGNPTPASAGTGVSRNLYFPPELTLGTLNGLTGSGSVALAPNATIRDRGTGGLTGFRVTLKNFKTGDTLTSTYTVPNVTATLTTSGTDKILEISSSYGFTTGTAQALLRGVKWSTTSADRTARTIEVNLRPNNQYLYETRHFYQYLGGTYTSRANASTAAQASYLGSAQGYLPTILSGAENSIVKNEARGQVIWLGGRNSYANWSWNSGPDSVQFWDEPGWRTCVFGVCGPWVDNLGVGGSVGGRYSNWQTGLFGVQVEPNNSSDDLSMDANGQWDDGIGWFTNPTLVAEYGNAIVGDSTWDPALFKSQSFTFDSTAPTLTLSSSATLVNDRAVFTITGSESIDCATLTMSDVVTTGIDVADVRISQVAPTVCEISAAHTLTPGVSGTITLAKSGTFSMTDAAGNAQTTISAYAVQTITATPPVPPSSTTINNAINGANYTLVPPSSTTTGMTPTDPSAAAALNTALTQAKIVEPPAGAPGATGSRNISTQPTNTRYELSDRIEVIQGTKVGAEFRVNSGRSTTHEAWGYIRIGSGDWLNLGKQSLLADGSADLAKIGAMAFTQVGTYQLKIVVVPVGTIMPARVFHGASFRPTNSIVSSLIGAGMRFSRAAVTDSQLQGVGDDSYLLDVNVIPAVTPPTVTPVAPYVVSTTAAPTSGTFKAGSEISVTVTFSVPVDVSGVPQVKFTFDGVDYFATYQSGTGTTELIFTFAVQAGQNTSDLDYSSATALELNGGSIVQSVTSGSAPAAMLGLSAPGAAGSISAAASVVIDTTAPKVSLYAEAVAADSTTIHYTVEGDTDIDCSTLSTVAGHDFTLTGISAITGIVQTTSKVCTITATSSVAPGSTGPSTIAFAPSFAITDVAGNATAPADLIVTIASIDVSAPATPVAPPTPTPTPSVSPTPSPSPSSPRPTPSPSASGGGSSNPSPSPSGSGGVVPGPSASPSSSPSSSGGNGGTNQAGGATDPGSGSGSGGSGLGAIDPTDPVGSLGNLLDPTKIELPNLDPGAPVANPAIGATGDDNAPTEVFNPFGTSASTSAVTALVTSAGAAVAAVSAVAAAAAGAAASAAGAASASSATGSAAGANASASSSSIASASVASGAASASTSAGASGAAAGGASGSAGGSVNGSALTSAAILRNSRYGQRFSKLASFVGRVSPLLAKILMNATYLRSIVGKFYPILPAVSIAVAIYAAVQNGAELSTPAWQLFIVLAVIGIFDALSGAVSFVAFLLVSVFAAGVSSNSQIALLIGIALIWFGPGLVARAFRSPKFNGPSKIWELAVQVAISAALVGWITVSAVSTLPAIAGTTLVAANHVTDFALALSIAVAARVLVEALIARKDPSLVIDSALPQTSWAQRIISWLLRFGIFALIAGAIFGYNVYVLVGTFLFVLPIALHWFANKLPNFPWLWRMLPAGLPGLNLVLVIAGFASALAATMFSGDLAPAQAFMLLPIPLLVLAILGLFGRHGVTVDAQRPVLSERMIWVYRIGGIIMFVISLKLMGII